VRAGHGRRQRNRRRNLMRRLTALSPDRLNRFVERMIGA
jgi:hypothetical protein